MCVLVYSCTAFSLYGESMQLFFVWNGPAIWSGGKWISMWEQLQNGPVIFTEKQSPISTWMACLTGCIALSGVYLWIVTQDPFMKVLVVLVIGTILITVSAVLSMRLRIGADASGICIRSGWFLNKTMVMDWADMANLEIVPLHPTGSMADIDKPKREYADIWICSGGRKIA